MPTSPPRSRRSDSTRTWVDGSRTARAWNAELLGWCALFVGTGVLGSLVARTLMGGSAGALVSSLALWLGMSAAVVVAFLRARPRGLLRFHPLDLLYAAALGLALRIVQGWLAVAEGDSGALPSYSLINGQLADTWAVTQVIIPVAVAPIVEGLLFHGVVVVAVYRIARRGIDGVMLAMVASTASFVAVHVIAGGYSGWGQPVALTLIGAACATLVLLTGRVWGAVLLHLVYNASFIGLALVGTFLG